MRRPDKILIGKSPYKMEYLDLQFANRHGLITGATGTGKTVTLQVLAEGVSRRGGPVFAADIKGDLSGIARPGIFKEVIEERAELCGIDKVFEYKQSPVVLWDVFGKEGHPIRANVEHIGPLLLSNMLELSDVQEGVMNIAFRLAEEEKLPLYDLHSLRALILYVAEKADELKLKYGNISLRSIGTIQRKLLVLEDQGGDEFLGSPSLDVLDFIKTDENGRGVINILAADRLMENPRLYSTFLLWMLTEIWQALPEIGDSDKPKLVFFFDEAHLLFNNAPRSLMMKIEQIARLVRSKGVGIYFITQNPKDVPDSVSSQLGNRIQHALRAYTPKEQRGIRAAAETFRPNPSIDTERAIQELELGEALVSTLENRGEPSIVQQTVICPPEGRIGPLTDIERIAIIETSPLYGKYEE